MRIFETIVILLGVVIMLLSMLKVKSYRRTTYVLLGLFLLLNMITEGLRYEVLSMILAITIIGIPTLSFIHVRRIFSMVIFIIMLSLIFIFPIYQMPTPTGSYDIGTKVYQINDTTRSEIYGDTDTFRKFNVQIWFPFEKTNETERAPWLLDQEVTSQALSRDFGFPGFLLNQTQYVESNSYLDADFTEEKTYPIVILSHGWSGTKYLHSDLGEMFASEGFIAVSIEHTYGSVASVIDNEVIFKQDDALTAFKDDQLGLESNTRLMMTYGLDVIATIDYLELLNNDPADIFYQHLDLNHIGAVGHSTGGGGVIYASLMDQRIKAIIGLDAWVEPIREILEMDSLNVPSLFLRSEAWEEGPNNDVLLPMIDGSNEDTSLYRIKGTTHYDFAMVYMYTSLAKPIGFSGSIETHTMIDIMFSSHLSYFNEHLKNNNNDISWTDIEAVERVQ